MDNCLKAMDGWKIALIRMDEETSLLMITSNMPFPYLLRIGKNYKITLLFYE